MANVFGKAIDAVEAPELGHSEFFIDTFQSDYTPANSTVVTLGDVAKATERVEKTFEQFPVDVKRAAALAKQIFLHDGTLIQPITLAAQQLEDGSEVYYNISGRHRLEAIKYYFEAFEIPADEYESQDILVNVINIKDHTQLVKLIETSNGSRTVRASEKGHLLLQELGGSADGIKGIAGVVLRADLKTTEKAKLLGQIFVRLNRKEQIVKSETALTVGNKVGKFILDVAEQEQYAKLKQTDVTKLMSAAFSTLKEVIEANQDVTNRGRAAGLLAEQVIEKLNSEFDAIIAPKPSGKKTSKGSDIVSVEPTELSA